VVRNSVRDSQIQFVIAIELARDHGDGLEVNTEEQVLLEASVAVAKRHRDVVGTGMGHHQILHPVVIEVAHGDRIANIAPWEEPYTPEGPVAIAQVQVATR